MVGQLLNSSSNEIFPTELWEMIIEQLEYSSDIQNVLRAFPLVDVSVDSRRKRFWYLDKILTLVCTWVAQKDVLNLRLVCKKWEAKVNSFLHNQPRYRAYSHDLHGNNPDFWMFLLDETYYFKDYCLVTSDSDPACFEELMNLPIDRNPFICRRFQVWFNYITEGPELEQFLAQVTSFLQKYGSHLWYLEFYATSLELDGFPQAIRAAMEMLKFVPNLKSLSFDDDAWYWKMEKGFEVEDFPELPFLETIVITNWFWIDVQLSTKVWIPLLKRYGAQIRRLELLMVGQDWDVENVKDLFPALTELTIENFQTNAIKLDKLLTSIQAPDLVKLTVDSYCSPCCISLEIHILKWLKLFPKIKYFGISSEGKSRNEIKEEGTSDPETDSIPSLQTLSVVDCHGVSYKFLKCFPNLRNLSVSCEVRPAVLDLSTPDSSIQLREHIQTGKLYQSNVWESLGKLNKVILQGCYYLGSKFRLHFDRERRCQPSKF